MKVKKTSEPISSRADVERAERSRIAVGGRGSGQHDLNLDRPNAGVLQAGGDRRHTRGEAVRVERFEAQGEE